MGGIGVVTADEDELMGVDSRATSRALKDCGKRRVGGERWMKV